MNLTSSDKINFLLNGGIIGKKIWYNNDGQQESGVFKFEKFETIVKSVIVKNSLGKKDLLLMSGGWDSGLLLELMTQINHDFSALSWGWGKEIIEGTDAHVARLRCKSKGIKHYYIDLKEGWTNKRIEDFFKDTDGIKTDHFNSYVPTHIRQKFHDLGFERIWRADESFGWLYSLTDRDTRVSLGLGLPNDFSFNRKVFSSINWKKKYSFKVNKTDRDLWYRKYRLPVVINTLVLPWQKSGFSVICPFIDEKVIKYCRRLNWHERTEKKRIKREIIKHYPDVAKHVVNRSSIPQPFEIWKYRNNIQQLKVTSKPNDQFKINNFFIKKLIRNITKYPLSTDLINMRKEIILKYN